MSCADIFTHIEAATIVTVDGSLILGNSFNGDVDVYHPESGGDTFLALSYEGIDLHYTVSELTDFQLKEDGLWANDVGQSLMFYRKHDKGFDLLNC